jgi:hypothetical protein
LGFALLLTACAGTGPAYVEHLAALPPIAPHSSRLTVFRTSGNLQYSGRAASVNVDGRELGSCAYSSFQTFYVSAGPHVLAAEMWDAPGSCRVTVNLIGGEDYFYEITPRAENYLSALAGMLIGGMAGATAATGAGFAAMGAESAGKACGGAFSIVAVDENVARDRLKALRMSH